MLLVMLCFTNISSIIKISIIKILVQRSIYKFIREY